MCTIATITTTPTTILVHYVYYIITDTTPSPVTILFHCTSASPLSSPGFAIVLLSWCAATTTTTIPLFDLTFGFLNRVRLGFIKAQYSPPLF